jgi:hypothetical protein
MPARPLHRRLEDLPLIPEPANDVEMRMLLRADDSPADLSITWVRIDGHHQRLRTDASTRLYQVLDGTGTITVGDEELVVAAGDLVVIPPSTPYHLDGTLTYLVLNQPGFRAGDDLYLDASDEVVGTEPPPPTTPSPREVC